MAGCPLPAAGPGVFDTQATPETAGANIKQAAQKAAHTTGCTAATGTGAHHTRTAPLTTPAASKDTAVPVLITTTTTTTTEPAEPATTGTAHRKKK